MEDLTFPFNLPSRLPIKLFPTRLILDKDQSFFRDGLDVTFASFHQFR